MWIFAYIDDFIIVSNEDDAGRHFNKLSNLFDELGLPMNEDKCCPPARVLACLGITIDLDANSISIESTKLEEIHIECLKARGPGTA